MNDPELIKVLLVDDDEDDFILTRGLFTQMKGRQFVVDWFKSYEEGLKAMLLDAKGKPTYDAIESPVCLSAAQMPPRAPPARPRSTA